MEYKFRDFEESDYEFVYNIKKQEYKSYVEMFFGAWNEEDQKQRFEKYFNDRKYDLKIIESNNTDIGFFDAEKLSENKFEINNICLIKEFQGKGIGANILIDFIKMHSDCEIFIQCFIGNPVLNLYKRLGFKEYEITKSHIKLKLISK